MNVPNNAMMCLNNRPQIPIVLREDDVSLKDLLRDEIVGDWVETSLSTKWLSVEVKLPIVVKWG